MSTIHQLHNHNHNRPAPVRRPQAIQEQRQEPRDRVELSPGACSKVPDGTEEFVTDCRPDRTDEVKRRQESTIRGAMASGGQCFEMHNSAGQREAYTLRVGESGNYELRGQDGHTLRVSLSELEPEKRVQALASIADFHSKIPPHLRDALDDISVTRAPRPTRHGLIQGVAQSSSIMIYEGLKYMDNGVLDHEFGHSLGHKLAMREARQQASLPIPTSDPMFTTHVMSHSCPIPWSRAIESDGRAPSRYAAENNGAEDFAESYVAYREAQEEGPEALAALRRAYPARMRYLDEVMNPPRSFWAPLYDALRNLQAGGAG